MKRFAVIGDPIAQSRSPEIYAPLFEKHGIEAEFSRILFNTDMLPDLKKITSGLDGFAVTMPLKKAIIPYLDFLDGSAEACGAVNIVAVSDGVYSGFNTDGDGLVDALMEHGFDPYGKKAFILGRGGAALSAYRALERNGAKPVLLVRSPSQTTTFDERLMEGCSERADLFVNATPLGMKDREDFADLGFLDTMRPDAVFDMVYLEKGKTRLVAEARERGVMTLDGSLMLLKQALRAFRIFTGVDP
ncbi:MAG: shikimate dehydrogenase [Clostridia bacterium]|nr:shikimate dehydrogenase [Clostridia bacterium]